ncbi:MAG: hypothetical protein V1739_07460 [Candidatus Omnitrophota bacterium]
MNKKNIYSLMFAFFFCGLFVLSQYAKAEEELIHVPTLIQVSSRVSDGRLGLSEIVAAAKKSGIKAVIFTDRDIMRWEYGIWPLRNIVKKAVINNSVDVYGIKKYLGDIEKLQVENPDIVLIPGVETTPFYYWSGSLFKMNMALHDAHKHMLVFGFNTARQFKNLPTVNNRVTAYNRFDLWDILLLWPFLVIAWGIVLIKKEMRFLGAGILVLGILFAINNLPFKKPLFDQYHGDQGALPYQAMIDYVNERQGMSFWSHPEAKYNLKTEHVSVVTEQHSQDLLTTHDYSGFCVFPEGYKEVGKPGGIWDTVLSEYMQGERKYPVWAIGGLAYDYYGEIKKELGILRNIVLVNKLDRENVLKSIREGRLYVIRGKASPGFVLNKFAAADANGEEVKTMGQTLMLKGDVPLIEMSCDFKDSAGQTLEIKLIKNKEIFKIFKQNAPIDIRYIDRDFAKNAYYRLEITGKDLHVITNPIFVRHE